MNSNSGKDSFPTRKTRRVFLLLIFILALVLRLWALERCRFLGTDGGVDGVVVMVAGKNLFSGSGYSFQGRPETVHAPLFSVLAGLLWFGLNDLELAGLLISVLAGALAVFPVYLLADKLFERSTALLASLMTAVFPVFIYGATEVRIASLYALLFLWIGVSLYGNSGNPGWGRGLLAGSAVSLGYLARPEALLFLPLGMILPLLRAGKGWRRRFKKIVYSALGMVLAFAVISFPYWHFLHRHLDRWTLSGRAPFTFMGYFAPDLQKSNFDSYVYPERIRREWEAGGGMTGFLREKGGEMTKRLLRNLATIPTIGRSPEFKRMKIPPPLINLVAGLILVSLIALIAAKFLKHRWKFEDTFLLLLATPLLLYLLLTDFMMSEKLRYLYPYYAVFIIILCRFLTVGTERIAGGKGGLSALLARAPAGLLLAGMALISIFIIPRKLLMVPYEYKLLGRWMKENLSGVEESAVMSQRLGVPFYAGARHLLTYPGSYEEVLNYARQDQADYLVVDEWSTPRQRPALKFLLDPARIPPGIEKIKTVRFQGRTTVLYKFK